MPRVRSGRLPLVLAAPHGGRRDTALRPWELGSLRVNDLHTAELTRDLADATGAAYVVNDDLDRNALDLNCISAAHDEAPGFLSALTTLLEETIAEHGRATVLAIHGWNIVEPAVDVGIGLPRGADPFAPGPTAAVSPRFASTALPPLLDACAAAGILATVGARYPARSPENLIQLFTTRHVDDARPLVRRLAALHERVEAAQLELSLALRLPGPWRDRMFGILTAQALSLASAGGTRARERPSGSHPHRSQPASRLHAEFTSPHASGLIRSGARGTMILLTPTGRTPLLFTTDVHRAPAQQTLRWLADDRGQHARYAGPMAWLTETPPSAALERMLAGA